MKRIVTLFVFLILLTPSSHLYAQLSGGDVKVETSLPNAFARKNQISLELGICAYENGMYGRLEHMWHDRLSWGVATGYIQQFYSDINYYRPSRSFEEYTLRNRVYHILPFVRYYGFSTKYVSAYMGLHLGLGHRVQTIHTGFYEFLESPKRGIIGDLHVGGKIYLGKFQLNGEVGYPISLVRVGLGYQIK